VNNAVDVLADILQNSTFEEQRIERERDVILREMQEIEGVVSEVIFDHLHATAFQYTPLGRTILGSADNIRSISKANLKDYITKHYTGPRMVVAAAGAVNHDDLVKEVENSFQNLSTDPISAAELVEQHPAIFTGSEVRIRDDDMPLVHFAVAVKGAAWTDPDSIALMVMQTMLGGWNKNAGAGKHMGSELAQKVGANHLAEDVMAFNTNYNDAGLFGIYATSTVRTSMSS